MKTMVQTDQLVDQVRQSLGEYNRQSKTDLHVPVDGWVEDGDWLYIIVTPEKQQIRASEYVEVLDEIEQALKKRGLDHVLLVPARPE